MQRKKGGKGCRRPESLKVQAKNRQGTLRAAWLCDLLQGPGNEPNPALFLICLYTERALAWESGDLGSRPGSAGAFVCDPG